MQTVLVSIDDLDVSFFIKLFEKSGCEYSLISDEEFSKNWKENPEFKQAVSTLKNTKAKKQLSDDEIVGIVKDVRKKRYASVEL